MDEYESVVVMVRSAKVWMLLNEPFFPLHLVLSVNGIFCCCICGGGDTSVLVSASASSMSMLSALEQAVVEVVQLA